jgi:hypothetical protein
VPRGVPACRQAGRGTILNNKSLPGSPALCLSRLNGARETSIPFKTKDSDLNLGPLFQILRSIISILVAVYSIWLGYAIIALETQRAKGGKELFLFFQESLSFPDHVLHGEFELSHHDASRSRGAKAVQGDKITMVAVPMGMPG